MANVVKYPIIGGPLDGKFANRADFRAAYTNHSHPEWDTPRGRFAEYRAVYADFNNGSGRRNDWASMVWLHRDLLRPSERMPQ